jgi:hypothetical protein
MADEVSMIERVARAIATAELGPKGEMEEYFWEKHRELFLAQARAAIEAMREPTDAMIMATGDVGGPWDTGADADWYKMIDVALKETLE